MRNVTRVYRACAGLSLFSLFYAKIAKMKIFLFPHAPDAHMHGTQGRQTPPLVVLAELVLPSARCADILRYSPRVASMYSVKLFF